MIKNLSIVIVVLLSTIALAQSTPGCAAGNSRTVNLTCRTTTCTQTFQVIVPVACDSFHTCFATTTAPITCCGATRDVTLLDGTGGGAICQVALMKDPKIRTQVLLIARTRRILIPTCNGAYVPAESALR
jgi:hypothetical protein